MKHFMNSTGTDEKIRMTELFIFIVQIILRLQNIYPCVHYQYDFVCAIISGSDLDLIEVKVNIGVPRG